MSPSLFAEKIEADISGYGQQVAFQVFIPVVVHIADKTKKGFLGRSYAVSISGLVTTETVDVIIIFFRQQI